MIGLAALRLARRTSKIIGWLMAGLLLLSVILVVALLTLIRSESGSAWLINTAVEHFVEEGEVGSVSGSLARGLTIESFSGVFGETTLTLPRLEARVEWRALLRQSRLEVAYLRADGLRIVLPPGEENADAPPPTHEEPAGAWPSVRLPIDIHIRRLQLTDTLVKIDDTEHRLHQVGLSALLTAANLELAEFHVQYDTSSASLMGRVATSFPYKNDLRLDWMIEGNEPWSGRARIHGDLQRLQLEHRLVGVLVGDTNAKVATGLQPESMTGDLQAMTAEISNVIHVADLVLDGLDAPVNANLRLDLHGAAHHWRMNIDGLAEVEGKPLQLTASGAGDLERFELHSLTLDDGSGALEADGNIRWGNELAAELQVAIDTLDLSRWLPDADLQVAGRVGVDVQQVDGVLSAAAALQPLAIDYDELSVEATGHLSWTPERMSVDDLLLAADGNRLALTAFMEGESLGAEWQLRAPRLGTLGEQFQGSLNSDGNLSGTLTEPRAEISLRGEGVVAPGVTLESVSLTAEPQGQGLNHRVNLDVANLGIGETQVDTINLQLVGAVQQHRLTVDSRMGDENLLLELSGGYEDDRWRGRFETLHVDTSLIGGWVLHEPATAIVATDFIHLEPLCLQQEESRLCLRARQDEGQHLQMNVELVHFPLHRFNDYWPTGTGVRGWLDGRGQVVLGDAGPQWRVELDSDEGHLLYAEIENELETFPYTLYLRSRGDATEWQADGRFTVAEQGTLDFDVSMEPQGEQRLRGQASARFVDLSWLDMFASPASDIGGELRVDLDIGGAVNDPVLEGELRLQELSAYVAPLGIQLEDGHLEGRFNPSGLWEIRGGLRSGEGFLNLDSTIDLSDPQDWQVEFSTSGDRLLVIDTPEIRSLAGADLRGRLSAERGIVSGRIGLANTRIRLVELPAGQQSITLSDDEVLYPSDDETETEPPYDLIANIELVIEDEIDFEGYGLSARADGRLSARYRTGRPVTAEGRFAVIEGRYRAYGQNLNIERGEVYFNGPLDNPAIDIRASRTIRDVTAGIQLGGRVQSLTSSIYSDPPMAPSDAMAFLLTGRPLSGASHEEANMLLSAVATLGIEHGDVITGGIQSAFGLDTFAIEGGETVQDTALVIGKNLTPKLLISYSEKLFERASTVTLSYDLTRRTKVQAESGEGQSVDIIFSDEFGQ